MDLRGRFSNPEVRAVVASIGKLTARINSDHSHTAAPTQAPRRWRLVDRLGAQVIGDLLRDRHAGATHHALAERYGISLSSVKRVLRRHRGQFAFRFSYASSSTDTTTWCSGLSNTGGVAAARRPDTAGRAGR